MVGLEAYDPAFKLISVKKLHPTFAAEISGVNFSKPLSDEVFNDIHGALAKVCKYANFHNL